MLPTLLLGMVGLARLRCENDMRLKIAAPVVLLLLELTKSILDLSGFKPFCSNKRVNLSSLG